MSGFGRGEDDGMEGCVKCLRCGREMRVIMMMRYCDVICRCSLCCLDYELDQKSGDRSDHFWRGKDGRVIEVPSGCLLVMSWDEA